MRFKRCICIIVAAFAALPSGASAREAAAVPGAVQPDAHAVHEQAGEEGETGEKLDIKGIVFEHLGDAYEWHITNIGNTSVAIPLPVIVRGKEGGWQCFMSSRISHGNTYRGFSIATAGKYSGKIVERNTSGTEVRPLDLSLTRNALSLMIAGALTVWLVLSTARWYRKRSGEVPKGIRGFIELIVEMMIDDVIKPCVGKDYRRYAPYLLTAFFFILINNLLGLVPVFPGGANVTGNMAVTLVLALFTFFIVNFNGTREYWKEILWPDVPMWLKVPVPLMPVIELFGIFTKPFALMVRLFANMMAGHAMILGITCVIFVTASMAPAIHAGMSAISVMFVVFMSMVELLVAFIQAYVFTMLSAVFIGLARVEHHKRKPKHINN